MTCRSVRLHRRRQLDPWRVLMLVGRFQDQPQLAEVLRHCRLDPGGGERRKKPGHGLGGMQFHAVEKRGRGGRRRQEIALVEPAV